MNTALKILMLEDSMEDAEMIQRLLKKEKKDCEFFLAKQKSEFLKALDEFSPKVILSDHSIPQFNSADALAIARQKLPDIPFIMVTGAVSEEFAADILKKGADDYILKDRMARLPAAINAALQQRNALKELIDYKFALDQSAIVSMTDQKGVIIYINENFSRISKYSEEELLGNDHRIVNSGYHPKEYIKSLWQTITQGKIWKGELKNKAKDGSFYWVDATIIPFLNTEGQPYQYLAIRNDITERIKAEEELRKSEMRLNEAQAITHISSWEIDLGDNIHTWSDEVYRIYGLNKTEVTPSIELFLSFIHYDDADVAQQYISEAFQKFTDSRIDFKFVRKDGQKRYGHIEWRFEFDEKREPVRLFGILQDITERKEAEESLKTLEEKIQAQKIEEQKEIARAIITGQEKERNYIGQELHDNINQILAGTKMYLSSAGKKNPEIFELVKYPMELIDSSIAEIRLLCQQLVTPYKNIDLEVMVQALLNRLEQNTTTNTDFLYTIKDELLSDDLKLNIYRIIQEQLNNIVKYAEAENVSISIEAKNKNICIVIKDDGKGFDFKPKREGIGISNMINRAESFNGKAEIKSKPGKGCKVTVLIPVSEKEDDLLN
ncbi:MAG: PAS domain S-box protein [Ferruginibacter sp.]